MKMEMKMNGCDVFDCNDEAAEIIKTKDDYGEYSIVNLCSFHYQYYESDKSIEKGFTLKKDV